MKFQSTIDLENKISDLRKYIDKHFGEMDVRLSLLENRKNEHQYYVYDLDVMTGVFFSFEDADEKIIMYAQET